MSETQHEYQKYFPGAYFEKTKKKNINDCCTDVKNHKKYDCYCSWGCNCCGYSYQCKKCNTLIDSETHKYYLKEQQ